MKRTRAERRHNDFAKAKRKWRLDLDTALDLHAEESKDSYNSKYWLTYNNLHQYSKNKIYCSCWMCAKKTNPRKFKHMHGAPMNWSVSDKRKLEDMDNQEQEQIDEEK